MNRNRNRRKRNNENNKPKKVIRCKALNRPVFGHEVCSQYSSKINSNNINNCENCRYTF
jgi:hypothetical protein